MSVGLKSRMPRRISDFVRFAIVLTATVSPFAASAQADPDSALLWVRPPGELKAYRERPLFSPDRKPPPLAAVPVQMPGLPDANGAPFDGVLIGVISPSEGAGQALVREVDGTTVDRISIGGNFKDWKLIAIDRHSATFEAQGRTISVKLGPTP